MGSPPRARTIVALILRTDTTRNRIGFVRAKDLKARDHVLDDDT